MKSKYETSVKNHRTHCNGLFISFSTDNLTTYLNSARCASAWLQFGGVCIADCGSLTKYLIDLVCKTYW